MNKALKPGPAPEPERAAGLPGTAQTALSGPETPVFPRSALFRLSEHPEAGTASSGL